MARLKAICFVDDDLDEIQRFRDCLRDLYMVGAGLRLDEAMDELKKQGVGAPDIVLLDLYHGQQSPDQDKAQAIAKADVELSAVERRVRTLLAEAGQAPGVGFTLAEIVKRRYPRTPILFFSRKAFLEDALTAYERGIPVLPKPDPEDLDLKANDPLKSALCRNSYQIATRIDSMIADNTFWARNGEWLRGFSLGIFFFVLPLIWEMWKSPVSWGSRLMGVGVLFVFAIASLIGAWFRHS